MQLTCGRIIIQFSGEADTTYLQVPGRIFAKLGSYTQICFLTISAVQSRVRKILEL